MDPEGVFPVIMAVLIFPSQVWAPKVRITHGKRQRLGFLVGSSEDTRLQPRCCSGSREAQRKGPLLSHSGCRNTHILAAVRPTASFLVVSQRPTSAPEAVPSAVSPKCWGSPIQSTKDRGTLRGWSYTLTSHNHPSTFAGVSLVRKKSHAPSLLQESRG